MQRQKILLYFLLCYWLIPYTGMSQSNNSLEQLQAELKNDISVHYRVELLHQISDSLTFKDKALAYQYAQEAVDMLPQVTEDTLKLKAFYSLNRAYFAKKEYSNCMVALDSMFTIAKDLTDDRHLWKVYFTKAVVSRRQRKAKQALGYFEKALALNYSPTTTEAIFRFNNNLGLVYRDLGQIDKTERLYLDNLELTKRGNKPDLLATANYSLAELHRRKNNTKLAEQYFKEALRIWKSISDCSGQFRVYNALGIMNKNLGNYAEALKYYDLLTPCIRSAEDEAFLYSNQGILYKNMGEFDKALENYAKAEAYYILKKDSFRLQMLAVNKGIVYKRKGEYDLALKFFQEEVKYREKVGDPFYLAASYRRLCDVYLTLKDYELVLEFAQKAMTLSKSIDDKGGVLKVRSYIGEVYLSQEKFEKAEAEFRQTIQLSKEIGEKLNEATNLEYLGEALWGQKRYKEALECQFEVLEKAKINNSKLLQVSVTGIIAKHLIELKHQGEKELALNLQTWSKFDVKENLEYVLEDAERIGDFYNQQLIYDVLSDFYEYQQDYQKAHEFKTKYAVIKDSVFTQEKTTALAEMQTKFETERTAKENELLKTQNDLINLRNRNYLLASALLLALLFVGGILYWQLDRAKNQLQTQNKTIESQNLELLSLNKTKDRFFGIIAHDLRSPILAFQGVGKQINYYLKKDDKEKLSSLGSMINQTAIKLNRLLDNLLNWALLQTGKISFYPQHLIVEDLVEEVEDLFLPVAQAKNITISSKVEDALEIFADEQALDTILRNLVSNALKFTRENGSVSIEAFQEAQQVVFIIQDTGVGIAPEVLDNLFSLKAKSIKGTAGEKGTGLGLVLCQELVNLHKGTIEVQSKLNEGTRFSLSFPSNIEKVHHQIDDARLNPQANRLNELS